MFTFASQNADINYSILVREHKGTVGSLINSPLLYFILKNLIMKAY